MTMIKTNNGKQRGSWGNKRNVTIESKGKLSSAGDKNYTPVLIAFLIIGIAILVLSVI